MQKLLGVKVDGIVGEKTLAALNAQEPKLFFAKIKRERIAFIQRLVKNNPRQKVFEKGWLKRLNCINYGSLTCNKVKNATLTFNDV